MNLHQNKPPTWLVHLPGHSWVLGQATGTLDHKTHHGPDSGEATTFPHIVFSAPRFGAPRSATMSSLFPESASESPPPSIAPFFQIFLRFSVCFLAAMMDFCFNSEGQRDPKLSEYQQVAVRVRGAGCRDREELGKRESGKPILNGHNGDDDEIVLDSPTPSSDGIPSAKDLHVRSVQDPDSKFHKTNASPPGSTHLWDKSSAGQVPAHSVIPKEQTMLSKGRGEARKNQSRSNGKTSSSDPQRLLLSQAPDEEMAQADKSTTERSKRNHLT